MEGSAACQVAAYAATIHLEQPWSFPCMPSLKFCNPLGTIHGGWISAILDSAMGCAVHSTLAAGQTYTTTSLTVNFVRPVFESTGKVRCEGVCVHSGSRHPRRVCGTNAANFLRTAPKLTS
jgi:uncharacterized protein (TIGR00369 family)